MFQDIQDLSLSIYLIFFQGWCVFNFTGWSSHSAFLQTRHRLDEVPGTLKEEIVVVVQGVHRRNGKKHLGDI